MRRRKSSKSKMYIHEPKEVSRQQLINQLNLQYNFDFMKDKTLASRKLIKKDILWLDTIPEHITKSVFNMSAAYVSCFFFTSYICTHADNKITKDNNPKEPYHAIYDIPVSKFCEIVGTDTYEEKNILFTELKRVNGLSKVIDLGDRYGYLPPFEIHFFSKNKSEMSLQELQRMINTESGFPIATINIKFLKVLYDRFLHHKVNYINYPVKWPKLVRDFCKRNNNLLTTPEAIMKAFTYLNIFDNAPLPRKNINVYEMIYYSAPGAIQIKNGKWYLRKNARGAGVLIDTFAALQKITTEYRNILDFSLDGILIPFDVRAEDYENLTAAQRVSIVLNLLDFTNGILPVRITRNKFTRL